MKRNSGLVALGGDHCAQDSAYPGQGLYMGGGGSGSGKWEGRGI